VATLGSRERAGIDGIAWSAHRSALAMVKGWREPVDVMHCSLVDDPAGGVRDDHDRSYNTAPTPTANPRANCKETFLTYATCVVGFGFMANMVVAVEAARDTIDSSIRTAVVGGKKLITEGVMMYPAEVWCRGGTAHLLADDGGADAGAWRLVPELQHHSVNVGCNAVANFSTNPQSRFFPANPLNDGTLRVMTIRDVSWLQSVEVVARLAYNGSHIGMPEIAYRTASEMLLIQPAVAKGEERLPLNIDGEIYNPTQRAIKVRCEHKRLTVLLY
jgi:diacylglycerol kinase family enzyme